MTTSPSTTRGPSAPRGFTLTELLIVILIIVLLTAATLPAVLPALNSRRVSEGSRIIQSELARARDTAVRANAPRGFRLVPDPIDAARPDVLTSSRLVALEPASDYDDGSIQRIDPGMAYLDPSTGALSSPDPAYLPIVSLMRSYGYLPNGLNPDFYLAAMKQLAIVHEVKYNATLVNGVYVNVPATPTSWYWNIRQGDRIQLSESGRYYTIAGPMLVGGTANPERYINFGLPSAYPTGPGSANIEFLILTNGQDDTAPPTATTNGFVDEGFDGVDNDGDGVIDPGFDGVDNDGDGQYDNFLELFYHAGFGSPPPGVQTTTPYFVGPYQNEFEPETFVGKQHANVAYGGGATATPYIQPYSISRRPVPSEGAREVALPTNVVVDLTTWHSAQPERSRLPVDPNTGYVDVMVAPNGQILVAGPGTNVAPPVAYPFYHFWLTEREDVFEPFPASQGLPFQLPMPKNTGSDPRVSPAVTYAATLPTLKGERRLLSVNTRSGAITATSIETFYANNPSYPFEAAEAGVEDAQP